MASTRSIRRSELVVISLAVAAFFIELGQCYSQGLPGKADASVAVASAPAPPSGPDLTPAEVAEQQNYRQPLRPQFHYTVIQGHIGDATGQVSYRGEFHLFNIFDEWARKSSVHKRWGHAVSTDLIHWTQMPPILDTLIDHAPGSGSGVIDWNNTSGLRNGAEKTMLEFYTDYKAGSSIIYSNDRGRTWVRYKGNPILPGFVDIRDPNVFWYARAREWRMVRYEKRGFAFYRSADLLHWSWLSRIDGFYECPDLIELPVGDSPHERKWVLIDGDGSYLIGNFDGTRFVPETSRLRAEYGGALYATQTWKRGVGSEGPIQMAWLKYPPQTSLTWDGQMSFPVTLSLGRLPEGVRLVRQPISAIRELYSSRRVWTNLVVDAEHRAVPGLHEGLLDLNLSMRPGSAAEFGVKIHGEEIFYSTEHHALHVGSKEAPLELVNGSLRLRILIDRSSIEVFTNPGQVSFSNILLTPSDGSFMLFSRGGQATVISLEVNALNSVWPGRNQKMVSGAE